MYRYWRIHDAVRSRARALARWRPLRSAAADAPRVESPDGTRSLAQRVDDRRTWLFEHLPPASAEYHYDLGGKDKQKRLARHLGLETAREHLSGVPLDEALEHVERERLDRFVVKPLSSRNGIGCRCLVREGDGYLDLRSGRRHRLEGLRRSLRRDYGKLGRPDEWIVEELLMPADGSRTQVDDVKLYAFAGTVRMIAHKKVLIERGRARARRRFYTRNWEPLDARALLGEGMLRKLPELGGAHNLTLDPPRDAALLVEVAEAASSRLCHPFIRIDLYPSSRGVVLGEFTPGPGERAGYAPAWDAHLCRLWDEAERKLEHGLRTGAITPLLPECGAPGDAVAPRPDAPSGKAVAAAPAAPGGAPPSRPDRGGAAGSVPQPG